MLDVLNGLIYPSFCSHCQDRLDRQEQLICRACLDCIEWKERESECEYCCFEHEGPIWMLFKQKSLCEQEVRCKLFASLLVIGWSSLSWPLPDVIIPLPQLESQISKKDVFGIARAFAHLLGVFFQPCLTVTEKKRYCISTSAIKGKVDQTILLFNCDLEKKSHVNQACLALSPLFPRRIDVLALFGN